MSRRVRSTRGIDRDPGEAILDHELITFSDWKALTRKRVERQIEEYSEGSGVTERQRSELLKQYMKAIDPDDE